MTQLPGSSALDDQPSRPGWVDWLRLLVEIARPRVIGLVVFTGLPALALGRDGWVPMSVAIPVLLGTGLAGAASSALNAWVERESDARMARTRKRPLPAAVMLPNVVLGYGVVLTLVSTAMLWSVGGPMAAGVSLATIAISVLGYTVWLKPRTPQNIVIGGAAGGTAPLIVSAAADHELSLGAWLLFLIVFLWTPPHFWAIAIFRRKEYEQAGFPMMPSVVGDHRTRLRSVAYTVALVAVTLVPTALGYLSAAYAVTATILGLGFLALVVQSVRADRPLVDWRVFKASVAYLGLLFTAMLGDLLFS